MRGSARPYGFLIALLATVSIGCGQIELPVDLALVGDNTISIDGIPFPPPFDHLETELVGGVQTTIVVDLDPFELFSPNGLVAAIVVDRVLIAGTEIDFAGLPTGTICIHDDPLNPSGGFTFMRPLQGQADFQLTLNTLISLTDPFIAGLFPPLEFSSEIDETVPITLLDLLGLLVGGTGGGFEVSQSISDTIPPDVPILANAVITADLTLATADFPVDPLLDECEAFLAGP